MSAPEEERLGMETVESRVTLLLSRGGVGGARHLKELTAVAFTLALIVFALIWFWGGHIVQCYPPIISAIAETLQWKKTLTGFLCLCTGQYFHPAQ